MTPDELHVIETTNGRLFALYHAYARTANGPAHVHSHAAALLMDHLDRHFPGEDVAALLEAVRHLQGQVLELTRRVPAAAETDPHVAAAVAEVLRRRNSPVGCCNRHADNQGCGCLERARRGQWRRA